MKKLHIIGTGGLAKELLGYIEGETDRRYGIVGCWADDEFNNSGISDFYKGTIDQFKASY